MVMARRVKFAAAIREGGGRRRSLRERRVSPHVQMMERKDRPMPVSYHIISNESNIYIYK